MIFAAEQFSQTWGGERGKYRGMEKGNKNFSYGYIGEEKKEKSFLPYNTRTYFWRDMNNN